MKNNFGNLYNVALSTLFSNPFGSFWVDFLSKLTFDLIDDIGAISDGYIV